MATNEFSTVEVGDTLYRSTGVWDEYKVVDVEETFGDRVSIEVRPVNAEDNHTAVVKEAKFDNEFEVRE